MSFEEALDQTAKKYNVENWKLLRVPLTISRAPSAVHNIVEIYYKEAAELYARSKFDEAIEEMKAISQMDSDCQLPKFED